MRQSRRSKTIALLNMSIRSFHSIHSLLVSCSSKEVVRLIHRDVVSDLLLANRDIDSSADY